MQAERGTECRSLVGGRKRFAAHRTITAVVALTLPAARRFDQVFFSILSALGFAHLKATRVVFKLQLEDVWNFL